MLAIPFFLSMIVVAVSASGQPTFGAGAAMVVSVGNDVGWQVTGLEEAREVFLERGELRGGTESMKEHWAKHGPLYG